MKKWCRKGKLCKIGKRSLAILLSVCLIGTMTPVTARAETEGTSMPSNGEVTCTCANLCTEDKVNSDCPVCGAEEADLSKCTGKVQSENNENQLNTGESEEKKNETELTITAWEWIDEEELINPETGILALPFANEETPAFFNDVVALLPTQIQATVVNEEDIEAEAVAETITLGDWVCEDYPKDGAYSGSYTFTATLPEGYALSEEAEALTVLVELGGAEMYATAEGYDADGFCTGYKFDESGNWVKDGSSSTLCTHEECNGYQPAVEEQLGYDINGDKEIDANDKAYKITNAGQLYWFADKVNNENATYKNINAVLTKDITVNEGVLSDGKLNEEKVSTFRSWTPIGYYDSVAEIDYSFTGIFDGQGNTISGLYFSDSEKSYVGLFGESVGKIKRVNVNDSYYCGKDSVGAICGLIFNKGTIEDSNNINSFVSGTGKYVGGVCGRNYDGTITNCENTGNVSNVGYIGGICGANLGLVKNCRNSGNITGDDWVGGVCGSNSGSNGGKLETSYNTGDVKGVDYVGGVCGYQSGGSVDSCYNTGNVTGTSTDASVGGVCGYQSGLTNNCYSTGGVTCNAADTTVAYVGGVCGLQWGTIKNCYYDTGKFTGKAIHTSKTSSQTLYVEGKTPEQFSDGMVAYLLNSRSAEDSPVWYQNIDNELEKNKAPVLDSSHGTVYASKPCPVKCSNTESTVSAESQSHSFGDDNICTVCGAKGEIIDDPTLINDKPSNVDGVYQIKTVREFYYFVALVNGRLVGVNQDTSASAVLKTDITVNDNVLDEDGNLVSETGNLKTWVPIGYSDGVRVQTYTGTFDGGGHTISGLYFDDKSISYVGLFGSSTRTIKNVKVVDSYFKGDTYVGGICGKNEGNIEGCEASGKIEANNQYADIGGICGYNGAGHVKNCTAAVKVNTSLKYEKAGGICGENIGTIEKCNSKGEININGSAAYGGGICGTNNSTGVIKSCYNTGTVYCKENAGGICGSNNGEVADCYNTGSCKASTLSIYLGKAGGICGSSSGSITNCYSTGNVSGYYTGKLCGNNSSGVTNCYYQDSSESDSIAGTTFKTASQFASGEVAYLLNEGKSDSGVVWRQTLDTDATPVLDSGHGIVYASHPCESDFANTKFAEEKKHTVTMSEDGTSHTCSVCKKTEQHSDVATFTVNETNHSITAICPSCGDLGTIRLSASDETYDGTEKSHVSGEIKGFTPTIVYEKQADNDSFETITSTPKDAGTYRASITLGTDEGAATVSVEFTIGKATPTISWGMLSGATWVEMTSMTVNYTGSEIAPDKLLVQPTVTLVIGETYSGEISYSYRVQGSSDAFTSGLPTEIGTYEVKASIAADGNYKEAASTVKLTVNWFNTVSSATLTDQGGSSLSGNDWWAQSVTFTAPTGFTISNSLTDFFGTSFVYNKQTDADGTEVTYYLKNGNGEIAKKTTTVRVDTTAPDWNGENDGINIKTNKWKSLLSTISFGLFYKETLDVTVSASDSLSGVTKYYYYVDTSAGETVKTKEELDALANGENGFTECAVTGENATQKIASLSSDSSCVVYVYAVDAVGNKSDYICSNGVVIDKTAPTISDISTPSKGSGDDDATLTDTTADMTFTASEGGTYFYIVKKSSEAAPTAITDFADSSVDTNTGMTVWTEKEGVTAATMTADDSNKISLTGLTANTAYTVYVVAVDKAGNISNILSQTFTTCKTMPKVTTNPTLSGTYGTAVSAMTLENGVAKAGDTVIDGTWTLTDGDASDVSSVGTTNTYEVTFTPADTYNGQYETVKVSVKPTVERKAVTVTAENKSKTYGQENPKLTFTVPEGSLVGSDTEEALGVTLSCEATKTSPVQEGGYAITGTSSSANYQVTVIPGVLTITKATPTITATASYSKTYGDIKFFLEATENSTESNLQYAVTESETSSDSAAENDAVVTVDARGYVTIKGAGSAKITASLPETTNYNAASKTIAVTVSKAKNAPNMPGTTMNVANSITKVGEIKLPADWIWSEDDQERSLETADDGMPTATANYNGADAGNYETESVTITITRSACEHVASDILYTNTEADEKEPTCTVDGIGHRECTKCKETIESHIIVKAAHQFSTQWTIDKEATTTEEGEMSHHCTRAGCDARTDITSIPKKSGGVGGGSSSGGAGGGSSSGGAVKPEEPQEPQEPDTPGSEESTTTTVTNEDGSTTTVKKETDASGKPVTTTTTVKTDGSTVKEVQKTATNKAGKEVAVTATTETDASGKVTTVTEKSVIEKAEPNTSVTVVTAKQADGKVKEATASVTKTSDAGKVSLSGKVIGQITEAAGTSANVEVTMTVKDSKGNEKYTVKADSKEIVPGNKLYVYKLDAKSGKYVMVNASTYRVSAAGDVAVNMKKKATYELVTGKEAAKINKQILATVKPAKKSKNLSQDKSTTFALSKKLNKENIKKITYAAPKDGVVTVSKKGKITATESGTTTVKATITLKNGKKKTIKMKIKVQ